MENGYGYGVWRSLRDGDFEEEDVWAVLKERKKGDSNSSIFETKNSIIKRSTSRIMIPRASSSSTGEIKQQQQQQQQSAPVTIPDWSKIYRKKSKVTFKLHDYEDDDDDDDDEHDEDVNDDDDDGRDSDDDEEEEDEYKIPPHELIARRLARSQISSFSVVEGAGRTLKGRDLSKVRNAVLTRTGFLE